MPGGVQRLREKVITVTTSLKPTNEQLAEMLERVLRELAEVKVRQDELADRLKELAGQPVG